MLIGVCFVARIASRSVESIVTKVAVHRHTQSTRDDRNAKHCRPLLHQHLFPGPVVLPAVLVLLSLLLDRWELPLPYFGAFSMLFPGLFSNSPNALLKSFVGLGAQPPSSARNSNGLASVWLQDDDGVGCGQTTVRSGVPWLHLP